MGIRFHCPNGHRLNVKSFLAGKRGYCPHCGVKVLIPMDSEPIFESRTNGKATGGANGRNISTPLSAAEPGSAGVGSWYVRPPSGGQFGPATADVINQWIAERRVPPNSLIWREGWQQWRPAAEVLGEGGLNTGSEAFDDIPNLGLGPDTPQDVRSTSLGAEEIGAGNDEQAPLGVAEFEIASHPTSPNGGKSRTRSKLRARAAILLGLAALVLLAALLLITTSRG